MRRQQRRGAPLRASFMLLDVGRAVVLATRDGASCARAVCVCEWSSPKKYSSGVPRAPARGACCGGQRGGVDSDCQARLLAWRWGGGGDTGGQKPADEEASAAQGNEAGAGGKSGGGGLVVPGLRRAAPGQVGGPRVAFLPAPARRLHPPTPVSWSEDDGKFLIPMKFILCSFLRDDLDLCSHVQVQ
uniref:Predicted protein n=1 Tax=Hordeum vulgare subsp. vulgare TaxID=112509 RepID=F2DN43_HORVV|nr:predicted protein [Hordeum vulgare subsp. vulgare]